MSDIKKCKYCQTEIDKKAKVCPNCKRTLKGHGCLAFIIAIILLGGGSALALSQSSLLQKQISNVSDSSEYITMEEYNKIKTGMTYEEVKQIVGSSGEISSQVEMNGYAIVIITWYGNGMAGSNANVTFTNNEVSGKAQVGLK